MNRDEVLKIIMKALDKYYEKRYNEYALKNDKNNAMYIAIEAVDVTRYIEDNLK